MVYEDALTILSYASPYDVSLELKKVGRSNLAGHEKKASMSSNDVKAVGAGSGLSSDRLYHPLYRSQSIDDLTQIGKDQMTGGMAMNGGIPPKRSLSIGSPMHTVIKEDIQKRERPSEDAGEAAKTPESGPKRGHPSSIDARASSKNSSVSSSKSKSSSCSSDVVITIDTETDKKQGQSEGGATVVELKGEPNDPGTIVNKPDFDNDIKQTVIDITPEDQVEDPKPNEPEEKAVPPKQESSDDKKSRKKNKAPQPPEVVIVELKDKDETVSSSEDENESFKDAKEESREEDLSLVTAHDTSFEPDSLEKSEYHQTVPNLSRTSSKSSISADSLDGHDSLKKNKSSSLGDISKNEAGSTDSLKRAVSLDMQKEQIPIDGQLGEQNKHLKRKAPNPPASDSTSADTLPSEQQLDMNVTDEPDGNVYKASIVEVVEADSLEKIPQDAGVEEPDSLEMNTDQCDVEITAATSSTYVIPINIVAGGPTRKDSTSSSSASESAEASEETITKLKVSPPHSVLDKLKSDSDSDVEIPKRLIEAPVQRRNSTSSSSSSVENEEKPPEDEKLPGEEEEPEKLSRRTSSASSVEIETPILKSTRKPVEVEFNFKTESSDSESDEPKDKPEKKIIPGLHLNLDVSMSSSSESDPPTKTPPASPEENEFMSSTPMTAADKPIPSINIPIIPPLIMTMTSKPSAPPKEGSPGEIIEISRQELDDVMMTHQQFVMKKTQQDQRQNSTDGGNDISFEDWSIMSNRSTDSTSINGSTTYSSSYETNISIDGSSTLPPTGFTVTPAVSAISKTVVITNTPTKRNPDVVKIVTSSGPVEQPDLDTVPELTSVE